MPSPFPGRDPYVESPLDWQDFHERFLPYAAEVVQPQLPDHYRARIGERVITVIELLSPTNKTPGPGREQYVHTQREVLRSGTNLVEIDLLHGGTHTIAVPRANLVRYAPFHGLVSVWRAVQPQQYEVYFVRLHERLPRLRIPLLPDDHDVALDLPAIYTRCYDAARYDLDLDYTQPPPVALSPTDLVWLANWLRDQGQRAN